MRLVEVSWAYDSLLCPLRKQLPCQAISRDHCALLLSGVLSRQSSTSSAAERQRAMPVWMWTTSAHSVPKLSSLRLGQG
jgi:hypothetical protein